MEIVANQKLIRMTPRKLRLVADAVRDLKPTDALVQLQFMHKAAALVLRKVMKQAVSNAVNNSKLLETDLVTKHILIDEGPRYKRIRAASRGRARRILKRTSHIKVVLETKVKVDSGDKASKMQKSNVKNQNEDVKTEN